MEDIQPTRIFESGQLGLPASVEQDRFIYRIVVISLGLTLLGSLAVITTLALKGVGLPDGVIALGSGALGALAGLLAGNR